MVVIRKEKSMARLNHVDILGIVDNIEGEEAVLTVVQSENGSGRRYDNGSKKFATVPVLFESGLPKWMKKNDIIRVSGSIETKMVKKTGVCPKCGTVNSRQEANTSARSSGTRTYVLAAHAFKEKAFESNGEAINFLIEHNEMSSLYLVGYLTKNPSIEHIGGMTFCRYQLRVRRQAYRNRDRFPWVFPWIYVYGERAAYDAENLKKDDLVLIKGVFQSRKYDETYTCANCRENFLVGDKTLEVVSLSTEYLAIGREKEK